MNSTVRLMKEKHPKKHNKNKEKDNSTNELD